MVYFKETCKTELKYQKLKQMLVKFVNCVFNNIYYIHVYLYWRINYQMDKA